MPGLTRHYEIWIGQQRSGKTHQMRRRVRVLASRKRIRAIFVFDTMNEWSDMGEVVQSFADYERAASETIPRVVVCQLGDTPGPYDVFLQEAQEVGNVVIVIDEAGVFAPPGYIWKSPLLRKFVFSGRHITNSVGEECVVHLIVATQYPKSVHHRLWSEASTVAVGKIAGENARKWVLGEFGAPELAQVDALEPWEWVYLRGKAPDLGPNEW